MFHINEKYNHFYTCFFSVPASFFKIIVLLKSRYNVLHFLKGGKISGEIVFFVQEFQCDIILEINIFLLK